MMPLRQSRWISTFLVAVIALAWLGASNHCALAAFEGLRKASHACCHEDASAPSKPQSALQCCDTFNVTMPAAALAPEGQLHALHPAWIEPSSSALVASARPCASFPATGPPRALGFAETVLNRSLLSHAPPHFVA